MTAAAAAAEDGTFFGILWNTRNSSLLFLRIYEEFVQTIEKF